MAAAKGDDDNRQYLEVRKLPKALQQAILKKMKSKKKNGKKKKKGGKKRRSRG